MCNVNRLRSLSHQYVRWCWRSRCDIKENTEIIIKNNFRHYIERSLYNNAVFFTNYLILTPATQNIWITFVQCWTNVEDVGPTLYKWYTNVLCLLGYCRAKPKGSICMLTFHVIRYCILVCRVVCCQANPQGSICLLYTWADTAFFFCRAAYWSVMTNSNNHDNRLILENKSVSMGNKSVGMD